MEKRPHGCDLLAGGGCEVEAPGKAQGRTIDRFFANRNTFRGLESEHACIFLEVYDLGLNPAVASKSACLRLSIAFLAPRLGPVPCASKASQAGAGARAEAQGEPSRDLAVARRWGFCWIGAPMSPQGIDGVWLIVGIQTCSPKYLRGPCHGESFSGRLRAAPGSACALGAGEHGPPLLTRAAHILTHSCTHTLKYPESLPPPHTHVLCSPGFCSIWLNTGVVCGRAPDLSREVPSYPGKNTIRCAPQGE